MSESKPNYSTNKAPNYATILFPPDAISQSTIAYLEQRREHRGLGVTIGLPGLDKDFLPLVPGELCSIIARPGCGKTGFMMRWARHRSAWLRDNEITDRVVLYITLEQSVEELNAFHIAADERLSITAMARGEISDEEWTRCLEAGVNRIFLPLWVIGYSTMATTKQIRIDLGSIDGALQRVMDEYGKKIDLIFVDYLQRLPIDGRSESKTIGVSDNLDGLKNIALRFHAPLVMGVQAKREVDDYADKIPELDDGQWTSNIEQSSDRIISLMRPAKYWPEGTRIEGGHDLLEGKISSKNMLMVYVLKQKLGRDNFPYMAYFDPEYNRLDELELRRF